MRQERMNRVFTSSFSTCQTLVVLILFVASSCNRLTSRPYLPVLEQGLADEAGLLKVPRGRVRIMSALSSRMEAEDWSQLKLLNSWLPYLQNLHKCGLITLTEEQQGGMDAFFTMGARFFMVSPTDKLLQLQDDRKAGSNFVAVSLRRAEVVEILKDEEYKYPGRSGTGGDDFRLILGKAHLTSTQQAKALQAVGYDAFIGTSVLRFRAILKLDPFTKTYTYVTGDVTNQQNPGWLSNNVQ